jgi:hypothetical protein
MKPDDSRVASEHILQLQRHARMALEQANAFGRFPTPVADVMEAAKLIVAEKGELTEGFLQKVRSRAVSFGKALKGALSKVLGVLDVSARIVYIDRGVHLIKRVFIKLHEAGHSLIPWQRDIYCAIEDCEKTLSPDISEAFDREANYFASEVLFQLDTFRDEAAEHSFGLHVPLKLSKQYGASVYSTIRRYVSTHRRNCSVLILDPPEFAAGDGFTCALRRAVQSKSFEFIFGQISWPDPFTPDVELGPLIPLGNRRMSRPIGLRLPDRNGVIHDCVAEAFKHKYQVFILIHEVEALRHTTVVRP